jgi:hypothetical protein
LLRKKRIELTGVEGCTGKGGGVPDGGLGVLEVRSGIDLSGLAIGVEAGVGVVTDPLEPGEVAPLGESLRPF